jgi:outer membrane protein TolC
VSGYLAETIQQISLGAEGLRFTIPGFTIAPTIGPFNNIDLRGSLSQSIVDLTAWNNYRSSREVFRASQFAAQDARELVVFAVCGAYLQVIATRERVKSAHAQLERATALFQQTQQKRSVGLVPQIDVRGNFACATHVSPNSGALRRPKRSSFRLQPRPR